MNEQDQTREEKKERDIYRAGVAVGPGSQGEL